MFHVEHEVIMDAEEDENVVRLFQETDKAAAYIMTMFKMMSSSDREDSYKKMMLTLQKVMCDVVWLFGDNNRSVEREMLHGFQKYCLMRLDAMRENAAHDVKMN